MAIRQLTHMVLTGSPTFFHIGSKNNEKAYPETSEIIVGSGPHPLGLSAYRSIKAWQYPNVDS